MASQVPGRAGAVVRQAVGTVSDFPAQIDRLSWNEVQNITP